MLRRNNEVYIINFIILAMAGHFASIVKAPITSLILISEMTGSLDHLLSLAVVVVVSQLTSDILNSEPIYESLLDRLLEKTSYRYEVNESKKLLLEVAVHIDSEIDGKYIKDILWPENCLVVSILRGNKEIIPRGDIEIIGGDYLTIMTNEKIYSNVLDSIEIISTSSEYKIKNILLVNLLTNQVSKTTIKLRLHIEIEIKIFENIYI